MRDKKTVKREFRHIDCANHPGDCRGKGVDSLAGGEPYLSRLRQKARSAAMARTVPLAGRLELPTFQSRGATAGLAPPGVQKSRLLAQSRGEVSDPQPPGHPNAPAPPPSRPRRLWFSSSHHDPSWTNGFSPPKAVNLKDGVNRKQFQRPMERIACSQGDDQINKKRPPSGAQLGAHALQTIADRKTRENPVLKSSFRFRRPTRTRQERKESSRCITTGFKVPERPQPRKQTI